MYTSLGLTENCCRLDKGQVIVFVPPKSPRQGLLLYAEQATRLVWHGQESDPLSHRLYESYFNQFFAKESLDKHGILPLLIKDAGQGHVQFRTAAEKFKLISDEGRSILVPYGEDSLKWIQMLRSCGPERYLLRKLQRYSVNVYENEFCELSKIGAIEQVCLGIWAVVVSNAYSEQLSSSKSNLVLEMPS